MTHLQPFLAVDDTDETVLLYMMNCISCTDTEEGPAMVQLKQVPAAVAACLHKAAQSSGACSLLQWRHQHVVLTVCCLCVQNISLEGVSD